MLGGHAAGDPEWKWLEQVQEDRSQKPTTLNWPH